MRAGWFIGSALLLAACGSAAPDPDASEISLGDLSPEAQVEATMENLLSVMQGDASEEERPAALDKALSEVRGATEKQERINDALEAVIAPPGPEPEPLSVDDEAAEREELQAMMDALDALLPDFQIEPEILDRVMSEANGREAAAGETEPPAAPSDTSGLQSRTVQTLSDLRVSDWPNLALAGGIQNRLIRRHQALMAIEEGDAETVQSLLSEMDAMDDPYRHYIRALASYDGIGMPKTPAAVLGYAEAAVEAGVAEAPLLMNSLHLLGIGTEPDLQKARLWHLRAMEAGLPDSYKMFGDALVNDVYGPIDPRFALHVLEDRANRFDADKRALMADLLITGAGGRTDLAKAHEIATDLAQTEWDETMKAKGEALLARPEFAAAGFSAEK